jgi:hypothetical protein
VELRFDAKFSTLGPVKPGVEASIMLTIDCSVAAAAYSCLHGSEQTWRRPSTDPFAGGCVAPWMGPSNKRNKNDGSFACSPLKTTTFGILAVIFCFFSLPGVYSA